ncbi:MAG TPA: response regulator [Candidatus Dormibacteraeota bacterium]|nr:response regulator [Candidatus Dormibacteraeota bacterium]
MPRRRILLVEDNERNMKLLRDVLRASGYDTIEATTGRDALTLAADDPPHLVLMDIRLPDMDGLEVLARLRSSPATETAPVVAVTAQAMKGDRERFVQAGFDDYLSKPIDVDELLEAVARHAGRSDDG